VARAADGQTHSNLVVIGTGVAYHLWLTLAIMPVRQASAEAVVRRPQSPFGETRASRSSPNVSHDEAISPSQVPADLVSALDQLDHARVGRFHVGLTLLAGIPWLWVSVAIGIIGFLLPSLDQAYGWGPARLGLLVSAGLVGFLFGALLSGPWTDRIGRKRMLLLTTAGVGLSMAISGWATSFASLLTLRILTGFASGAVMPVTNALVSEYSPARYRGRVVVLLSGFWGLGGAAAALIGYLLVPTFGWRPPLWVGGAVLLYLPVLARYLPRSLRFLIAKGKYEEAEIEFAGIRSRLMIDDPPESLSQSEMSGKREPESLGDGAEVLWSSRYLGLAIALSIIWFTLNFAFYGVFIWLPSVLVYRGSPLSQSLLFTLVINLGQVPGTITAAFLADWLGRRISLVGFLAAYAASLVTFAVWPSNSGALLWGTLFAFCNSAAWGLGYILTVERFPTSLRATGLGWTNGIGRTGGILAPAVMGLILASDRIPHSWIFYLTSIVLTLAIVPCLKIGGDARGLSLEELSRPGP
jgi:putative MFS transporter